MVEDFKFMTFNDLNAKDKNGQDIEDKLNLASQFKIKKVKAGTRIFEEDQRNIDCLHLVLRGKTGILCLENAII